MLAMRPMLVNTKQKIAVLASGLAIATTGLVTDDQANPDRKAGAQGVVSTREGALAASARDVPAGHHVAAGDPAAESQRLGAT